MREIIIILITIISVSCNFSKKESLLDGIKIKCYPTEAIEVNASDTFSNLEYIPLETAEHSLLGEVNKIEFLDSMILVSNNRSKTIVCFNNRGEYLKTIGFLGRGPGEHLALSDFTISPDKTIQILDRTGRKIITRDLNNKFIGALDCPVMASNICSTPNGTLYLYTRGSDYYTGKRNEYSYNLFEMDNSGNILRKHFSYNPATDNIVLNNAFDSDSYSGSISFHYGHSNHIYMITDSLRIAYTLDFGESNLPLEQITTENSKEYTNSAKYANLSNVLHSKDKLFINYSYKNRVRFMIYNKNNEKVINSSFLNNDMDATSFKLTHPLKMAEDKLYFIKGIDELNGHPKDEHNNIMLPNGRIISNNSNQVLVIATLKNME